MINRIRTACAHWRIRHRALSDYARQEVLYYEFGIGRPPSYHRPPPDRDIINLKVPRPFDEAFGLMRAGFWVTKEQEGQFYELAERDGHDMDFTLFQEMLEAYEKGRLN